MRIRVLPVMIAALALPVAALAHIGPRTGYYDQHPPKDGLKNDVSVRVDHKTHAAQVEIDNFCFGSSWFSGNPGPDPNEVTITTHVRHGKISFHGKGSKFTSSGTSTISAKLSATVTPRKVTGDAQFPGTKCGKMHFVAKLQRRTP
jgi:hypothetical protein